MKTLTAALFIVLIGCKKEQTACEVGDTCAVKANVFNKGTFQPHSTLYADSTYIDRATHLRYLVAIDNGGVKWYFPQTDLFKIN